MNSLMLSRHLAIILFLFCIYFGSGTLKAEFIFLITGEILEGTVVADTPATVTIRDKAQKVIVIKKSNVLRIQFAKLYTGKVFVQKTDGINIMGYVVDENSESYTMRSTLDNPNEFIIQRDQVLFMARGNPSRLQNDGEIGADRVFLKWDKPYNPVSRYLIYVKGPSETSFTKADECHSTKISLKNLERNTRYTVKVTSVDESGEESLPSNEFSFSTRNFCPLDSSEIALGVHPCYIKPIGAFGEFFNYGYGVCAAAYFDDILIDGFDPGLSAAYWRLTPKLEGVRTSYMVPVLLCARFRIPGTKSFSIVPTLEGGVSYNNFTYTAVSTKSSKSAFEPMVHLKCDFHYRFEDISIIAGIGYLNIFEQKERMSALTGQIGINVFVR